MCFNEKLNGNMFSVKYKFRNSLKSQGTKDKRKSKKNSMNNTDSNNESEKKTEISAHIIRFLKLK